MREGRGRKEEGRKRVLAELLNEMRRSLSGESEKALEGKGREGKKGKKKE